MTGSVQQIQVTSVPGSWKPKIGDETMMLRGKFNISEENKERLLKETIAILSQCGDPNVPMNNNIGLVFGYVQSGKTMSFTTLTALAKDNGYRMVIIIAGVSTNLVDQSYTRLERDLSLDTRDDLQWLSVKNAKRDDTSVRNQIQMVLSNWKDLSYPEEDKRTILITVMKQKNHLQYLRELLESVDMQGVPTLIIDDEADQHSMNTRNRQNARSGANDMSMIHRRIMDLRNTIPHHTFIQYTATPQAPLFQDNEDNLSPNFIELITPGDGYTGGQTFFESESRLTHVINDLVQPQQNLNGPPASLRYAMQIFFLGVVAGKRKMVGKKRSMMIHPSALTFNHSEYNRFVTFIKQQFLDLLERHDGDQDRADLLQEFRVAYDDLATTVSDIPAFAELTSNRLQHAIKETVVQSLNSRGANKTIVEWRNSYSWILIGGQAMDRGFTVEGLTVTYMPRSVGVGNADTIQQRARFFGYKNSYLGYCRVYLDQAAHDTYVEYIRHEEDMRRRLSQHKAAGKTLNDWYREVILDSTLNLARPAVFSLDFQRAIIGGEWQTVKVPQEVEANIISNRQVLIDFLEFYGDKLTGYPPVVELPLQAVYDELLSQFKFTSEIDLRDYPSLLCLLQMIIEENPDENCSLFLISSFEEPSERGLNEQGRIKQLFQGPNKRRPGHRNIKGSGITIQIYVLDLKEENNTVSHRGVVTVASFIPIDMAEDIIRWA